MIYPCVNFTDNYPRINADIKIYFSPYKFKVTKNLMIFDTSPKNAFLPKALKAKNCHDQLREPLITETNLSRLFPL